MAAQTVCCPAKRSSRPPGRASAAPVTKPCSRRHFCPTPELALFKLEAAVQAVGESDPTHPALHDALKRARAQAELRSVQDRISATETFFQIARNGEKDLQETEKARAVLSVAEAKLHQENESISQLRSSSVAKLDGVRVSVPPPTSPVRFWAGVGAVASFSARVDARTGPAASRIGWPEWRGRTSKEVQIVGRAFNISCIGSSTTGQRQRRDASSLKETLIDQAHSSVRRVPPISHDP